MARIASPPLPPTDIEPGWFLVHRTPHWSLVREEAVLALESASGGSGTVLIVGIVRIEADEDAATVMKLRMEARRQLEKLRFEENQRFEANLRAVGDAALAAMIPEPR